jgi:hypothetical protein
VDVFRRKEGRMAEEGDFEEIWKLATETMEREVHVSVCNREYVCVSEWMYVCL